jgi:hypothetical protein
MRYLTSTIAAFTFATTVGVLAQQPTPAPPPAPAPAPATPVAPKSTLTGCVAQAKTTDGGTAYVLSKVEGGSANMYVLGGSQSDFSTNVNKKVEVSGSVQEPANATKDSAPDPKILRPPLIVVESVKVVAQSCS